MGALTPTAEHTHAGRHALRSWFRTTYLPCIVQALFMQFFWCLCWFDVPILFLFFLTHLPSLTCLYFFCLLMFFENKWMLCKSCVSAMFVQQGQEDGKSYLAYKDGGEVQTRAVMPDSFRSIAKCRVRETRTAQSSQNVLSWALQQGTKGTHVNRHQSQQTKNMLKFSFMLC